MWFIGVEVEQETSAPHPKKNPGSAPENCHLHMPVRPTLLFRKNLGNLREFFEQIVYRPLPPPPAKNCPYAYVEGQHRLSNLAHALKSV